ncbi:MAG: selenide, water dikinase SelD [Bacteroidetes bacterium]|nr:MAG: selenide, water dikinase SelD [Bacteroidota bacterium]REJ99790.1 MAG: selenide, water dikinase SelD [Bacteroidota bacterium]REK34163.1 MAG: selenide, water dikinase SelD [Bacteroidota bacterium]REK50493.1 MAG: selenide, water dikinase SelD [Bacteroidota bacterium]
MNTDTQKNSFRLTQLSQGGGCGCKIAPAVLEQILQKSGDEKIFPELLVGYEHADDAAVYEMSDGNCIISTVDFFTPVVDDPYDYGRIASANALSDVYAMGGKPLIALAVLGFPVEKLSLGAAKEMIRGAKSVCEMADIPLAGGHSINISEPVFGLSLTGIVSKDNICRNHTAKSGDLIFLTKALGTGIISTAIRKGKASDQDVELAVLQMTQLNNIGSVLAEKKLVSSMTDVTGFGLLGHLIEMCDGSGLSAELYYKKVPLLPGLDKFISSFVFPDNTYRNWNAFENKVQGVNGPEFITLCDPQSSGGLLFAVSPHKIEDLKKVIPDIGEPIGQFTSRKGVLVSVQ